MSSTITLRDMLCAGRKLNKLDRVEPLDHAARADIRRKLGFMSAQDMSDIFAALSAMCEEAALNAEQERQTEAEEYLAGASIAASEGATACDYAAAAWDENRLTRAEQVARMGLAYVEP